MTLLFSIIYYHYIWLPFTKFCKFCNLQNILFTFLKSHGLTVTIEGYRTKFHYHNVSFRSRIIFFTSQLLSTNRLLRGSGTALPPNRLRQAHPSRLGLHCLQHSATPTGRRRQHRRRRRRRRTSIPGGASKVGPG